MTDPPPSGRLLDVGAAVLLVLSSAALFTPWLLSDSDFIGVSPASAPPWMPPVPSFDPHPSDPSSTDALLITWPNLVHWTDSVRHDWTGLLWNPFTLCGSPFLASQIGFPLYPSNLLALFGGFSAFFLWSPLLHVALANVGAYFALRRLALSRFACMVGAWSFGAGSWFLAHLAVINFPQAAAWLPWIILASDRAQVGGRARDRLFLGATIALSVFAGMIQITLISLLAAAILVRVRAEHHARSAGARAAWRGLASAGGGLAIGLLLAGPQLLPLIEWSKDSSRVLNPAGEQQRFAYRPLEWAHLLVPEILGSPSEISRWTRPGAGRSGGPAIEATDERSYPPAVFAGARGRGATFLESVCSPLAVGLVLGLCALFRPRKMTLVFLAMIAAGALLAMDTPFLHAVSAIPGGASGNPRRVLLLAAAGFAGLAAVGADRIRTDPRLRPIAWVPACLVGAWLALDWGFPHVVEEALRGAGADPEQAKRVPWLLGAQALIPFLFFAVAGTAAGLERGVRWRLAALLVLAGADAVCFNLRNHPLRPRERVFPETEMTRLLAERGRIPLPVPPGIPVICEDEVAPPARIARFRSAAPLFPPPMPPNTAMCFRLRDEQGYGGVLPRRLEQVLDALEPGIVSEHVGVAEWRDASVFALPAIRFLNVRHVISAHHEVPHLFALKQFSSELCSVFENPGTRPRVTAVTRARAFDDEAALLRELAAPDFDPAVVLLLRSDLAGLGIAEPAAGGTIDLPPPEPGESVRWTQKGAGVAEIDATLHAPRFLVVAESFHPGWKVADQGGRTIPVVPANHAFQAVFLPAGRTQARLVFAPASFALGAWAFAFGALASLADMMLRRRTPRRAS